MKYELIIAEKPNAALKIAEALADKKTVKKSVGKISYYELEHKGKIEKVKKGRGNVLLLKLEK